MNAIGVTRDLSPHRFEFDLAPYAFAIELLPQVVSDRVRAIGLPFELVSGRT